MTKKFEEKQKKLIEFIKEYTNKHGYSPSYREMTEAIGLKTISTINYYIKRCEEQGLVRKDNRKGRTITVCETKTTKKQKNVSQKVRHQICEEIREKMCCIYDYKNNEYLNGWNDAMHTVYDKLDQIEQGENK